MYSELVVETSVVLFHVLLLLKGNRPSLFSDIFFSFEARPGRFERKGRGKGL